MELAQSILVITATLLALWILYAKFFKKAKKSKACGNDDCGC